MSVRDLQLTAAERTVEDRWESRIKRPHTFVHGLVLPARFTTSSSAHHALRLLLEALLLGLSFEFVHSCGMRDVLLISTVDFWLRIVEECGDNVIIES